MHEEIMSFVRDEGREYPFFVEMAGASYCDGSYRIERASSPHYVLEYVLRGRGTVINEGRGFTAEAGDTYLLHSGSRHEYFSDSADPWVKVWVNFYGPAADSLIKSYGLGTVNHVPGLDLSDLFDELLAAARSAHGSADGMAPEAAVIFHKMVARMHAFLRRDEGAPPREAVKLKSWLDRHIYSPASMQELAGQIYRSPSHASRIFKSAFGTTPYEYLLKKRIETAKLLLLNTTISVKEIAYKLNFADEHYFSNYFKKRAGLSPAQYRGRAASASRSRDRRGQEQGQ